MDADFDKFSNIKYMTISRLFWNRFPFKVVIKEKLQRPEALTWGVVPASLDVWGEFVRTKTKFYYARKKFCPTDRTTWKSMNNGTNTYSFFFEKSADALYFIEKNHNYISSVYRPETTEQISALASNNRLILRDNLFYNKYRYCIEFREQDCIDSENSLDEIITNIFNNKRNSRRYLYTYSRRRRLYLNKENDIFHVKLAVYDKIRNQTEVLLKKEI